MSCLSTVKSFLVNPHLEKVVLLQNIGTEQLQLGQSHGVDLGPKSNLHLSI